MNPETPRPVAERPLRTTATVAVLALVSLVVQLPFLGRGMSLLDEGSILAIADAMASSEQLYVDRVTPLAPLTYELLAALFRLFGTSLEVARALQALAFSGCVLLTFAILRPLAGPRGALAGAVALLALKPLGFPLWTIVNYSQLAMLFCLAALFSLVLHTERGRRGALLGAGFFVGLTVVTKQNLGALIAAVIALGATADIARRDPRWRPVAETWGSLALGGAVPVAATALLFAARGNLEALFQRAIVGLTYLADPYFVPLPGLSPWAFDVEALGPRLFAYFPSPLFDLAIEGALDLHTWPFWLLAEIAVKLAFYLPVGIVLAGFAFLGRDLRRGGTPALSIPLLALVLFAALSYASMLYRADWTHLTNIYPAVILLAVALAARGGGSHPLARGLARAAFVLWMLAGAALTFAVLYAYQAPLATPRGQLRALPSQALHGRILLAWLAEQPREPGVAILRTDPLYYFLADRRPPLPFDLLVPGYLTPEDDLRTAERIARLDRVVYNPKQIPTMPMPITEYAPATSAVLARLFRAERPLSGSAIVLARAAASSSDAVVRDLWAEVQRSDEPAPGGGPAHLHPTSWLFYRVLAASLGRNGRACATFVHRAQPDHELAFLPMLDPAAWALIAPGSLGARFEVSVSRAPGEAQPLYAAQIGTTPPREVRIPLGALPDETLELSLCAEPGERFPRGHALVHVAFGEPRIVAPSAAGAGQAPSAAWAKAKR